MEVMGPWIWAWVGPFYLYRQIFPLLPLISFFSNLNRKYKEVSSNLHLSLQCIKKYESMNEKLKEKEIQTEDELCTLQKRLYESENLRAIAENSLNNLAQQVGVLEDELYEVKMKV
uniref:Uncharacterized protein n=1 Tax=Ciona intestinalis TaxID=7719 RepID=H2XRE4_CIOIN